MATPSKQPKLTYEILTEQSKEKEINDLKNQLEKQKKQKEKVREKDEALKAKEETIAELKSSLATEEYLKKKWPIKEIRFKNSMMF